MDAAEQERIAEEGDKSHKSVACQLAKAHILGFLGIVAGKAAHRSQGAPARAGLSAVFVEIAHMSSGTVLGERARCAAACPDRLHGAQQSCAYQGKQGDEDEGNGMLQHNGEYAEAAQRHRGHAEALYDKRFAKRHATLQPEVDQHRGRERKHQVTEELDRKER